MPEKNSYPPRPPSQGRWNVFVLLAGKKSKKSYPQIDGDSGKTVNGDSGSERLCADTKKWWLLPGSNQRPVDYDSIALPTELSSQPKGVKKNGSGSRTRTCDRVVNSHLLYRLSYAGATEQKNGDESTPNSTRPLFAKGVATDAKHLF